MITVIQRVARASVTVGSDQVSRIGRGLVILLGVARDDGRADAETLADKISHLRVFEDGQGKMNLSVLDVRGSALVVSQFTLLADTSRGRRPGFEDAAPPDQADALYRYFAERMQALGVPVSTGVFGAHMQLELENDGPVTLVLHSRRQAVPKNSKESPHAP